MKVLFLIIFSFFISFIGFGQEKESPFTQADRENLQKIDVIEKNINEIDKRLIVVETKIDNIDNQINSVKKQLSFTNSLIITLLISMFTIFLGLIVFIFWDRKTLMRPSKKRFEKIEHDINELKSKITQLSSS